MNKSEYLDIFYKILHGDSITTSYLESCWDETNGYYWEEYINLAVTVPSRLDLDGATTGATGWDTISYPGITDKYFRTSGPVSVYATGGSRPNYSTKALGEWFKDGTVWLQVVPRRYAWSPLNGGMVTSFARLARTGDLPTQFITRAVRILENWLLNPSNIMFCQGYWNGTDTLASANSSRTGYFYFLTTTVGDWETGDIVWCSGSAWVKRKNESWYDPATYGKSADLKYISVGTCLNGAIEVSHSNQDWYWREALYEAYLSRIELGLSSGTVAKLVQYLSCTEEFPSYFGHHLNDAMSLPNQNIHWGLQIYSKPYILNGSHSEDVHKVVQDFFYYCLNVNPQASMTGHTNLFADFSFRYLGIDPWERSTYGFGNFTSFGHWYDQMPSVMALTDAQKDFVAAYARQLLGKVMRNGTGFWDDLYGILRKWSAQPMSTGILSLSNCSLVPENIRDQFRWLFDKAIQKYLTYDEYNDPKDFTVGISPYYAAAPDWYYLQSPNSLLKGSTGASRYLFEIARAIVYGVPDLPMQEPKNTFTWLWECLYLSVATPYYSAASIPNAPILDAGTSQMVNNQHWGVSHITADDWWRVSAVSGYGYVTYCCKVLNGSTSVFDTSSQIPDTMHVHRDGAAALSFGTLDTSVKDLPTHFDDNLKCICTKTVSGKTLTVTTTFHQDHIRCRHEYSGTAISSGIMKISIPNRGHSVNFIRVLDINNVLHTVWNGTAEIAYSGLSGIRYIHIGNDTGHGQLLIPSGITEGTGSGIGVYQYTPASDQPFAVPSCILTVANGQVNATSLMFEYLLHLTDGTDHGADQLYAADRVNVYSPGGHKVHGVEVKR